MTRLYLIGGFIAALALGIWLHMRVVKENAQLEYALSQAGETIAIQAKDAKDKADLNLQLRQQQEELEHENARLADDLVKLPRTQAQRDCDIAVTPSGYAQRMLEYARSQGPISDPRAGMAGTNADLPELGQPRDLRPGQE